MPDASSDIMESALEWFYNIEPFKEDEDALHHVSEIFGGFRSKTLINMDSSETFEMDLGEENFSQSPSQDFNLDSIQEDFSRGALQKDFNISLSQQDFNQSSGSNSDQWSLFCEKDLDSG